MGRMRIEANISVSDTDELGTKVEVKNLNSFKAVKNAIDYEIERHIALRENEEEILQETRGWNDSANKTTPQRIKENAGEYRYMPEPDLPKYYLHEVFSIDDIEKSLPVLPEKKVSQYKEYGINESQTFILISNKKLGELFDAAIESFKDEKSITLAVNYITTDVVQYLSTHENVLDNISAESFVQLIEMIVQNEISSRGAKDILAHIVEHGGSARSIAEEKNLFQQSDDSVLKEIVEKILKDNPDNVEQYKAGKEQVLQFFVGQAMKETKGTGNPQKLQELFKESLK